MCTEINIEGWMKRLNSSSFQQSIMIPATQKFVFLFSNGWQCDAAFNEYCNPSDCYEEKGWKSINWGIPKHCTAYAITFIVRVTYNACFTTSFHWNAISVLGCWFYFVLFCFSAVRSMFLSCAVLTFYCAETKIQPSILFKWIVFAVPFILPWTKEGKMLSPLHNDTMNNSSEWQQ